MDLLITKKLSGVKLTDREHEVLNDWLERSSRNRELYFQLKIAYNQEGSDLLDKHKQEIWNRLKKSSFKRNTKKSNMVISTLKWAASIFIVCSLGWLYFTKQDKVEPITESIKFIEKESLPGQKITTILPDGTSVKLNSGSKIILPEVFGNNVREVTLIGEAYFEVKRDVNRPFIISSENFQVKVLGTSFNIKSYPDHESNLVAVKSGKVSVKTNIGVESQLNPMEMIEVSSAGHLNRVTDFDEDFIFGWVDQILVFKQNSLHEVISQIEKWYDLEVLINDLSLDQNNEMFTGSFQNPTVQEVMTSVSKAYKINFQIKEDKIIIMK